ncbi:MAG: HAMP domain-containing histidine kinase [Phycisphaerae bacterium]|nr:HAMP domain-containing histidine kinase [Phycisphaerae bacterium]
MKRPWHIWLAYALCLGVGLAGVVAISLLALHLYRAEADARRQALVEENVRLALWRMDSALAPLIAQENTYPYFVYNSFYSARHAYPRMASKGASSEMHFPSPLLTLDSPYIRVHFQLSADGTLSSPQVPLPPLRDVALDGYTTSERIDSFEQKLDELRPALHYDALLAALPAPGRESPHVVMLDWPRDNVQQQEAQSDVQQVGMPQAVQQAEAMQQKAQSSRQTWLNSNELQARSRSQQQSVNQAIEFNAANWALSGDAATLASVTKPIWLGDVLVLARRVNVDGTPAVQGCQLDWPAIRTWLLSEVADLLPNASLEPLPVASTDQRDRLLAALPVRLVPGAIPGITPPALSPILVIAWSALLLAAIAMTVLLFGTILLSERRASFVSAVTHELRTPLTTFRMYTEMLAEGMLTDAEKRHRYLDTLRVEAERLSHLVENVLAFARLERGKGHAGSNGVVIGELLDRTVERLERRAAQAGMTLTVELPEEMRRQNVRADSSCVEQILLNLVDNACKYAAGAADNTIHIGASHTNGLVTLHVRDHGPGIAPTDERRIFRAFHKSARQAAHTAPGVGLGLALSRRLARDMGGDLRLSRTANTGACFELLLRQQ